MRVKALRSCASAGSHRGTLKWTLTDCKGLLPTFPSCSLHFRHDPFQPAKVVTCRSWIRLASLKDNLSFKGSGGCAMSGRELCVALAGVSAVKALKQAI